MKAEKIVEIVVKAMPQPRTITNWQIHLGYDAVRFEWRGIVYHVSGNLMVEEVEGGVLVSSDRASLVEAVLKNGVILP